MVYSVDGIVQQVAGFRAENASGQALSKIQYAIGDQARLSDPYWNRTCVQ